MSKSCHYCGTTVLEMRPYGPGGSWVCFPCATSTPEREQMVSDAFATLIGANEAISPSGVTVLTVDGPEPFVIPSDMEDECYTCGDPAFPEGECPKSKRPCGHHCNHSWTGDHCHWCDAEFGEV